MEWLIALIGKLRLHLIGAFIALAAYLLLSWCAPAVPHPAIYAAMLYLAVHIVSDQMKGRAARIAADNKMRLEQEEMDSWRKSARESIVACHEVVRLEIRKCVKRMHPDMALYRPENHTADINRLIRADVLVGGQLSLPSINPLIFDDLVQAEKEGRLSEYLNLPG